METSKLWKLQGAAPKSGVPFARVACVYHCEGGVKKYAPLIGKGTVDLRAGPSEPSRTSQETIPTEKIAA